MLIRAFKLEKKNGAKRNEGTFRIDTIVRLIMINRKLTMILMRLITIKYFNRFTALILTYLLFIRFGNVNVSHANKAFLI